eukprot:11177421-Lingulodinium_polyedra.AAC.1
MRENPEVTRSGQGKTSTLRAMRAASSANGSIWIAFATALAGVWAELHRKRNVLGNATLRIQQNVSG